MAPCDRDPVAAEKREHYYLGITGHPESMVEVTQEEFILAERAAGFRPKHGCGPVATGGFGSGGIQGSVRYE